ncbi:hypothetical protein GP486_004613 [Trichoglossum hirsutum]|uniref:Uncharacterized protein n=1 Tax=Trichoglossum hirsutum TaxID=265104 RepID=A0A9P8LAS3_9PEZI|nr:hypothetical protein GP486_004613 [Trichoglossum hirsutum]
MSGHRGCSSPPLKRQRVGVLHSVATKELQHHGQPSFRESEPVVEQAEKYRLGTVRLPLDSLDFHWDESAGKNRQINPAHVGKLHLLFLQEGLKRKSPDNHLKVACRKSDVENILNVLTEQSPTGRAYDREKLVEAMRHRSPRDEQDEEFEWPLLHQWESVNGKAELMDGQHRVEALKLYIQRTGAVDQGWWPCALYDKDAMPDKLNIKLRANRRGATLPDSHGQIWQELHRLSEAGSVFTGNANSMRQEMLDELGLGGTVKFPIRRLVTLWRNIKWRDMITRWCETTVGRETFNVSSWDEMYWFEKFNNVLTILDRLGNGNADRIMLSDLTALAMMRRPQDTSEILELFFPLLPSISGSQSRAARRQNFLEALSQEEYSIAHRYVTESGDLVFEDLSHSMKRIRQEGKMISLIMTHVSGWLNYKPYQVVNEHVNNKPPIRDSFILALRVKDDRTATEESLSLQNDIIRFVAERGADLNNPAISQFLNELPDNPDCNYIERFRAEVWRDLLVVVRGRVGPNFKNGCMTSFNVDDPACIVSMPVSAITRRLALQCTRVALVTLMSHEAMTIKSGYHLVLTYNLIYYPEVALSTATLGGGKARLHNIFVGWKNSLVKDTIGCPRVLACILNQEYTEANFSPSQLKDKDNQGTLFVTELPIIAASECGSQSDTKHEVRASED